MLPINRLEKSNTTDNLWLYILAILYGKPLYGWEIPKLIEKEFGFRPGKITPYRVFYRLEADGFVRSEMDERRRIYKITGKGKEELAKAKKFYKNRWKTRKSPINSRKSPNFWKSRAANHSGSAPTKTPRGF